MENKVLEKYKLWVNEKSLSDLEHEELIKIKDDEEEIISRFKDDLSFGTAGLRGIMGLGANRMNIYTVRKATQGLANYLNKKYSSPKCAIAFDSRINSKLFALEAANVLAKNKIQVYIFEELMPTPILSYAVRYLKTSSGIVITASHNPKEYNGYKVYGDDGAQLGNESSNEVMEEIEKLHIFNDVKTGNVDKFIENGQIEFIKDKLLEDYQKSTLRQSLSKEERNLRIVYTPLHGAGLKPVLSVLHNDGFLDIQVVEEQKNPDGNFPTASYPNPEFIETLKIGVDSYLLPYGGDILLATDPDADRVGVVVSHNGVAINLSGNEIGILLFDWVYKMRDENHTITKNPLLVKTIVSTDLVTLIAKKNNVITKEVLTGFKYIGEQIKLLEKKKSLCDFLIGFEESCGYLTNVEVRDKDAVNAVMLIAEMANYYKNRKKTLIDRMNEIYEEYGYYTSKTLNYELPGERGKENILKIMKACREASFGAKFGELEKVGDYLKGEFVYSNKKEKTGLPKSDVVKFFLVNGDTITFRPSGTEPKLKVYMFAKGNKNIEKYTSIIEKLIKNI